MASVQRRDREKAEFREEVLRAARAIVLSEGFAALTMRKIAEAIEYAPGTIYLYFESRDAIAHELTHEGFVEFVRSFAPASQVIDPLERLRLLGELYVQFGFEHPQTYRLIFMEDPKFSTPMFKNVPADSPGHQALGYLIDAFDELKAEGRLSPALDSAELADTFWVAMHGIVSLRLTCTDFPHTPTQTLVRIMSDALFNGILQKP